MSTIKVEDGCKQPKSLVNINLPKFELHPFKTPDFHITVFWT